MKVYDLFDKPLNGLYVRTNKGGIRGVLFSFCCTGSLLSFALALLVALLSVRSLYNNNEHNAVAVRSFLNSSVQFNVDIVINNRSCDCTLLYIVL